MLKKGALTLAVVVAVIPAVFAAVSWGRPDESGDRMASERDKLLWPRPRAGQVRGTFGHPRHARFRRCKAAAARRHGPFFEALARELDISVKELEDAIARARASLRKQQEQRFNERIDQAVEDGFLTNRGAERLRARYRQRREAFEFPCHAAGP